MRTVATKYYYCITAKRMRTHHHAMMDDITPLPPHYALLHTLTGQALPSINYFVNPRVFGLPARY